MHNKQIYISFTEGTTFRFSFWLLENKKFLQLLATLHATTLFLLCAKRIFLFLQTIWYGQFDLILAEIAVMVE